MKRCSITDCPHPVAKREWCNRHYLRWRRHGDPLGGRGPWDAVPVADTEKACRRCGDTKPLSEFAVRSGARDGRSPWCRACFAEHYRANIVLRTDQRRRWNGEHPAYFKDYYQANRAKKIAAAAEYAKAHPDERRAWFRLYREANRDRLNAVSAAYQRRIGHKHSRARMLATRTRVVDTVDRHEVFVRGRGRCGICSQPVDPANFHVDHIVPVARGGEHSYANTQPAHPVCNLRKGARLAA